MLVVWRGQVAEQPSQILLSHLFLRHLDHCQIKLPLRRLNIRAIACEKNQCRGNCCSFVAIQKSLRLGEVESIAGRHIEQVSSAVIENVLRRSECRIHQAWLTNTFNPAMFGKAARMYLKHFFKA